MNHPIAPLGPGTQLDARYRLDTPIGRGGVGQVWRARDLRLQRQVAVKTIPHDQHAPLRQFRREVHTLADLGHPSIVGLHDAGQDHGVAYLVMELVDGTSLAEVLARGPIDRQSVSAVTMTRCCSTAASNTTSSGAFNGRTSPTCTAS